MGQQLVLAVYEGLYRSALFCSRSRSMFPIHACGILVGVFGAGNYCF